MSFSIVIITIISIINITIIIGSSSSSSVVLVVEIVNREILLVPVKFVVEYHALLSIVFFCLRVVFLHYFLVSVSLFKLNHSLRNTIIVISLHVWKKGRPWWQKRPKRPKHNFNSFHCLYPKGKRVSRAWLYWPVLKNTVFVLCPTVLFRWSFVIRKSRIHS